MNPQTMNSQDLDEMILNNMPTFIAVGYKKVLDATFPEDKIYAALHVYELCIRSLSIGLISQYLIRDKEKVNDTFLNKVLMERLPKGTLDTWIELLWLTLRVYVGYRDLFFIPELYDFYWDTSVHPHRPKSDTEKLINELLKIKYDIEYGNKPTGPENWQNLSDHVIKLLNSLMLKLAFISNYELIRINKKEGNQYFYERHVGLIATLQSIKLSEIIKLETGWFYLGKQSKDFLPLDPLLVFWEKPIYADGKVDNETDVAIFERFTNNQLQYLLLRLGKIIESPDHILDFTRIIFETIKQIKRASREVEKLTWWQLREIASEFSNNHISTIQDKYNPHLYLQREKTKQAFEGFLLSDKRCFVLLGKSGVGKSNFILSLKDEFALERKNISMIILDAANIDASKNLNEVITEGFKEYVDFVDRKINNIWQEIDRIDEIEDKIVLLCLDAINENPNAHQILQQANDLIQNRYTWLKIVITSRPESWINIKQGIKLAERFFYKETISDKAAAEMEGFSYSQRLEVFTESEIKQVYALYKDVYKLKTGYSSLSEEMKNSLKDPLVLWLISSIYQEHEIPQSLKNQDVIAKYIDAMIRSSRLESKDKDFLENELMPLMINQNTLANSINSRSINLGDKTLFERIHIDSKMSNDKQVNQSFVNLLDTEILIKKGDLWEYEIGFKYERFYDYFSERRLKLVFDPAEFKTYELLITKMGEKPFLWGGIKNLLMNSLTFDNVLRMARSSNYFMHELVISALIDYGSINPQQTERYLFDLFNHKDINILVTQRVKNTAICISSVIANKKILVLGCLDADQNIRATTYQQIYKLLSQGNGELALEIFDLLVKQATFTLNVRKLFGIIESIAVISLLILFNFADNNGIMNELKSRWFLIIKKYPLLVSNNSGGIATRFNHLFRIIVFTLVAGIITIQIKRLEKSKTAVVSVKDFNLSLMQPREQKLNYRKIMSYLAGNGQIGDYEKDIFEMINTREIFGSYTITLVLLAGLTRERENAIPLIERITEYSLNMHPPSLMLSGITLTLMHTLSTNLGKFDAELFEIYRKVLQGLVEKSRCVFTSRSREYTWWTYDLYTYYYNLHISEECPDETLSFIEVMEKDKKFEELGIFISFMADYNFRLLFVESNVRQIFKFLGHSNPSIRRTTINSISLMRSKYPLEIDQIIQDMDIAPNDKLAIENQVTGQDLGMIFSVSGMNFWSKAILHNDLRIIGYFLWLVDQAIISKNLRNLIFLMLNKLTATIRE